MKTTKVRVLSALQHNGVRYQPNAVIELDAESLEELQLQGRVDPHPDAVKYAESLHQRLQRRMEMEKELRDEGLIL
ncbi:hypothetical protein [Lysobacter sp. Root494]|uniref:DUF7210 family protein n=1 Tax=Lysobacter sp. Root494 TaxID=1736549 RepID=UPI0006FFFA64|nr:hypothetical protein [Lysobacter sp. Root494]KQY51190.1 hypothetical protein ASD14_10325 [Lysobacter sp. Root494]